MGEGHRGENHNSLIEREKTMKKVVGGKVYNTETAEEIAEWSNSYYPNDFKYCQETLYRTKNGAWFILGEGGAMSKYSQQCGNAYGGGSDIRPLTPEEAQEWLELHDLVDELEEHFADSIEEA
jgi:hypothetical protein